MSDYIHYKTNKGNLKKLDIFYTNFILPIKLQFDSGVLFLNKCLEDYYKSRQTQTKSKTLSQESEVTKYKKQLIELEILDLPRFKELKKKMLVSKEYLSLIHI